MPISTIVNGLTIFLSITTVGVLLYPLLKLTPSWLESRTSNKAAFHRTALEAIELALAQPGHDLMPAGRLIAQRDFHRQALRSLADVAPVPTVTGPLPIDLAA